ncbi:MAG: lectin-like protein [Candidatus Poribacteria bacterium]|nr:lectin-like protein [Candidatus Poribacteria bacterium]
MKRSYSIFSAVFLTNLVFLLAISPMSFAGTFSGRTIDEAGNPVADVTVALREYHTDVITSSITDDVGAFSVPNTTSPVKLMLLPENKSAYTIRSTNIAGVILYPIRQEYDFGGLIFRTTQKADIKDVEVIVHKRIQIKGRVLNPDGTPIKNAKVRIRLEGRHLNRQSRGTKDFLSQLDDNGYFTDYVNYPGFYTVSVMYEKMLAQTEEFLIPEKQPHEKLVLMLGGKTLTNPTEDIEVQVPPLAQVQKDVPHSLPETDPSTPETSTFSGHVVDTEGNAVSGFMFGAQPVQFIDGSVVSEIFSVSQSVNKPRTLSISRTNTKGEFSFTDIESGPLRLYNLSEDIPHDTTRLTSQMRYLSSLESEFEIISIKIGHLIIDNKTGTLPLSSDRFIFGIKPGDAVENVKITVKQRTHILGRVVYANGSSLKNASVKIEMKEPRKESPDARIRRRNVDDYSSKANIRTNDDGYFSVYVEKPGAYFFRVKYIVLTAEAGPVEIENKAQQNELILKLNGTLIFTDTPRHVIEAQDPTPPNDPQIPDVWVVNPANGHAYKLVACEDFYDAHLQATKNGAHLVSINDEAEHKWITEIFGSGFFWIGLNDLKKEGEWQWDGGEPATYIPWEPNEIYPEQTLSDAEKDYVVMNFKGGWQATGPESTVWIMTRQAILENDGLLSTIQPKQNIEDK